MPKFPSAMPLAESVLSSGKAYQVDPIALLTEAALDRLVNKLEGFGNTVSSQHQAALQEVLSAYTMIALGKRSGRWAFPLAPGVGKTQSIVAWLSEAWDQGYFSVYRNEQAADIDGAFSIAVSANKIEALCEIKRDLIEAGVPAELIGLHHSYQHKDRQAEDFQNGLIQELPEGHASEPRTPGAFSKPVLLCSHNLIKNRADAMDTFYTFRGAQRSLLIWDESLLATQATSVTKLELDDDIADMEVRQKNGLGDYRLVIEALRMTVKVMKDRLKNQEPGSLLWTVILKEHLGPALEFYNMLPDSYRYDAARILFDLSDEALRVADVYGQAKAAFIHYELLVSKELENIVILDASAPIRKLMDADKTIKTIKSGMDLVSYQNVTVRQLQWNSGRASMEKVIRSQDVNSRAMFKDIIEEVKSIPDDEGVLFFVFKPKYSTYYGRHLNFQRKLVEKLHQLGLPDKVMVRDHKTGEMVEKDRFNFLTHGNEASTSKFAFCKNVVFCGVLWRTPQDIAASTYGQTESKHVLEQGLLKQVALSEKAYSFHQGMCRTQCRYINGVNAEGKALAKPANVWLIYKDECAAKPMEKVLKEVLPGVRWEEWKTKHLKLGVSTSGLSRRIVGWLDSQDFDRISTTKLKKEMELQNVTKITFTRTIKQISGNPQSGWVLEGRSLVRDNYGFTSKI